MASYKIYKWEPVANANVHLQVRVFKTGADTDDDTQAVGHFTVVLDAYQVKQAEGMAPAERTAYLKSLFEADPRIVGIVTSEEAMALLDGWYDLPLVLTL